MRSARQPARSARQSAQSAGQPVGGSAAAHWRRVPIVLYGAGLALLVAGTFLPWLRSGSVVRNSYQTIGIARRLTALGEGVLGAVTAAWPAVGIAAALCAALSVLGARRIGAMTALLLAVVVGTVATLAMVLLPGSESAVRVIAIGPMVTLGGAVLALVGALVLLAWPKYAGRTTQEEQ